MLPNRSHRARQIARDLVEPAPTARLATLLLCGLQAAELQAGLPPRLFARHAQFFEHVGAVLEVKLELVAQVPLPLRAPEDHRRQRSQSRPHRQASPIRELNARSMALARR